MPIILPWNGVMPKIAADAFIAPNATIIGDVEIGSKASIWFNCVLRADVNYIRVGARTNIQDGTVVHVHRQHGEGPGHPTIIGDDVLIGHLAMIHGSVMENGSFLGMNATLLDNVIVESEAMVAAGALISPGKRVGTGQLWAGRPAKFMRELTPRDKEGMKAGVLSYINLAETYKKQIG